MLYTIRWYSDPSDPQVYESFELKGSLEEVIVEAERFKFAAVMVTINQYGNDRIVYTWEKPLGTP